MANVEIITKLIQELSPEDERAVAALQAECFSDVPQKDITEDFIAKPFGRILAYQENHLIGMILGLFKRAVVFDNEPIELGGLGGVCVTASHRRKGLATALIQKGLEVLKNKQCDIACLNVDLDKNIYGLYEKAGFTMMERDISFENVHGAIVKDKGTMFIPICSREKYNQVMNSSSTFHYGKGYW